MKKQIINTYIIYIVGAICCMSTMFCMLNKRDEEPCQLKQNTIHTQVPDDLWTEFKAPTDAGPPGHARFDNSIGPLGPVCQNLQSYGTGDEEKRACSLNTIPNCVVFSIGSNNQWGFEEDVHRRTQCRIETFDCTIPADSRPPAHIVDRTRFHWVCIADEDKTVGNQVFLKWKSLLNITGMNSSPQYLKMDIEGGEHRALREIIRHKNLLPYQIAFELHHNTGLYDQPASAPELWSLMQHLHDAGGYYLMDRRDNIGCPYCTELLINRIIS